MEYFVPSSRVSSTSAQHAIGQYSFSPSGRFTSLNAGEKLKEARYAFSEQEVKQYFPAPKVLAGLFKIVETLFDVAIRRDVAPPNTGSSQNIVRVELPAGARVAYPAFSYANTDHHILLLRGRLRFGNGARVFDLEAGGASESRLRLAARRHGGCGRPSADDGRSCFAVADR